jgi:hypothetical protein
MTTFLRDGAARLTPNAALRMRISDYIKCHLATSSYSAIHELRFSSYIDY